MLVVTSRLKSLAKEDDMRVSAEFLEAVHDRIKAMLKEAIVKAKEDKRGTVKARDLE